MNGAPLRSTAWPGAFLGIGLMGAVDEIVFHQLLQWHHFFVHTHAFGQIVSDGLFHIVTTTMLVVASVILWRRRASFGAIVTSRAFVAGVLLGMGGFQLFDGTVNHKLLQIHPVRVGVDDQLPYDAAWIGSALVVLVIGWVVWRSVPEAAGSAPDGRAAGVAEGRSVELADEREEA